MKAFVLKEPGVVGYEQVPEPVLTPYGAILKPVAVAPCSSDVHTVFGGGSRKAPNLVLGHECVARVLEVGEYVTDFVPGELVAVLHRIPGPGADGGHSPGPLRKPG